MSVRIGLLLISAAVVCCCAAPALAQQDYWDVSLPYEVARDNCDDSAGDTHPGEWHNNEGAVSRVRIKASDHQWYGDWDTVTMSDDFGTTPYSVSSKLWVVFDGVDGAWPDPASPATVRVAAIWSENDWVEGDGGGGFGNYNWTNPTVEVAATYMYAQDIDGGTPVVWTFPGNAGLGYARFEDCTFLETFLDGGDKRNGTGDPGWHPWTNDVKTIENTATYQVSWDIQGAWASVSLDAAMLTDLLTNDNNRGLVIYNLPPDDFDNHGMDSREFAGGVPYIEVTVAQVIGGDATLDGGVSVGDVSILGAHWGQQTGMTWLEGDFTGDGGISVGDVSILSAHWGWPLGLGETVPEPASLVLLVLGAAGVIARRRR